MKPHILIVDDEKDIAFSMKMALTGNGKKVSVLSDGSSALNFIHENEGTPNHISLLITDLHMPVMDGITLIDEVNKLERKIPILVATGFGNKNIVVRLIRKGVDEYIDKPFMPDELRERIDKILAKEKERLEKEEALAAKAKVEKENLSDRVSEFRERFLSLHKQVATAKDAYRNLVSVKDGGYRVNTAYRLRPLGELGGDFLDIRDNDFGSDVFVADVSGHDMGASYNTVLLKAFLEESCSLRMDGKSLFRTLNRKLIKMNKLPRMTTGVFARFNLKEKVAEITSAAHPSVSIVHNRLFRCTKAQKNGEVLGINTDAEFETEMVEFEHGDRFIFYTDGLPGAQKLNRQTGIKKELTEVGLDDLIMRYSKLPLEEMISCIWSDVLEWCNKKPHDDMLLLGVEV